LNPVRSREFIAENAHYQDRTIYFLVRYGPGVM
jgi:hypothetical protein